MKWYDNIGNELQVGDYVLCLSGLLAYTIQKIVKLVKRREVLFDRTMVVLEKKSITVSDYNVISLAGLKIMPEQVQYEKSGIYGHDVFGNPIEIGAQVLYMHSREMYTEIGVVTKLAPKTCIFQIEPNRFGQTSYKKPYKQIISLTALGLDESVINMKIRRLQEYGVL